MEEQQNNTDVQDTQANSGNGTPKVMKAGSEAKAGRRVLRSGASDSGNPAEGSDHATEEAARSIVRAGQQTLEGARAATYAAVDSGNPAEGSDHATEATRSIVRAGQQTLEGARAATYAAVDSGNPAEGSDHATEEAARSIVRAGQQTLEGARAATYAAVDESTGNGKVLEECASFIKRATHRNAQALGDLMHCYTFPSLLQWQNHLLNATITDLWETNSRILRLVTHKV